MSFAWCRFPDCVWSLCPEYFKLFSLQVVSGGFVFCSAQSRCSSFTGGDCLVYLLLGGSERVEQCEDDDDCKEEGQISAVWYTETVTLCSLSYPLLCHFVVLLFWCSGLNKRFVPFIELCCWNSHQPLAVCPVAVSRIHSSFYIKTCCLMCIIGCMYLVAFYAVIVNSNDSLFVMKYAEKVIDRHILVVQIR